MLRGENSETSEGAF